MVEWAAVILAAGRGERMNSSLPKVLHPVCGREMVRHVVGAVREVHSGPVVLVVPPDSRQVQECLGDEVEYVVQKEALGTGHALLQTQEFLRGRADELLVLYGDTPLILPETLQQLREEHQRSGAVVTLLTSTLAPPDNLGRIIRDSECRIEKVLEEQEANKRQLAVPEVNGGMYCLRTEWLWPTLQSLSPSASGEYYLTDVVETASGSGMVVSSVASGEELEIYGVNNRFQLAQAERGMRERLLYHWMMAGVTIVDPATTYVDAGVVIGRDTTIHPNTVLSGQTSIGEQCTIGPNSIVHNSSVGNSCRVLASMLEEVRLQEMVSVGPFSHLRPGTVVEREVHVGNYAEVKNSHLGRGTRMGHFSYIGDAELGEDVNIGAGTVTCNYDGKNKNRTVVADGVFLGCDTMLVAPLSVGQGAMTGAGAVVTENVPPYSKAIGVPARSSPMANDRKDLERRRNL